MSTDLDFQLSVNSRVKNLFDPVTFFPFINESLEDFGHFVAVVVNRKEHFSVF